MIFHNFVILKPKNKMRFQNNNGFIAITLAIILTVVILAIAIVFSSGNILGRFDSSALELRNIAENVALSCLEYGKLKLAADLSYGGNENLTMGSYSCTILPVEIASSSRIVKSTANVGGVIANIKITVSDYLISTRYQEVGSF